MANSLDFKQCATLLNEINKQATGQTTIAPVDLTGFIAQANNTLLAGYDKVINAISQVLSKTVFSIRPYSRKFSGLYMDSAKWGNHVRKLQMVDNAAEDDDRQKLVDGASVDQQRVNKPRVIQTNYYGAEVYQRSVTIFKDQLDVAFSSPEEFGRFISMVLQNVSDVIEKDHENMARMALCNFIAAKQLKDSRNVIKLVTKYNEATGLTLTAANVRSPENYVPFMKWALSYIKTISDLMTERSTRFHIALTGDNVQITRHTPIEKQKLYMYAADMNNMEASVLSSVFNKEYLERLDYEKVNYWQAIDTPTGISVKPSVISDDLAVDTSEPVVMSNILGVLFDEEAVGITTVNSWSAAAPFNARGGYTNTFWHFTDRYFNDLTENGVVFLME